MKQKPIEFQLDTGSDFTIISKEIGRKIGAPKTEKKKHSKVHGILYEAKTN